MQLVEPGDPWLPAGGCLKLELLQHTGTFKSRGAFNRVLATRERGELDPRVGIVVASGGNAGLAHAYAAAAVGVPATVFVPETSSPTKLRRLREYGALVEVRGREYADAYDAAMEHVGRTGAVYCHAYDQPEICAGAGTLGLELLEQLDAAGREVDTVLVAVGGGGLMSGVATAVEGRASVVGSSRSVRRRCTAPWPRARPSTSPSRASRPTPSARGGSGSIAWEVATRLGVGSVLVDDDAIMAARQATWDRYRVVLEAGAAAPVAALLSGAYRPADGERVAIVLCGANTDPSDLV